MNKTMEMCLADRVFWGLAVTALCLAILQDKDACREFLKRLADTA